LAIPTSETNANMDRTTKTTLLPGKIPNAAPALCTCTKEKKFGITAILSPDGIERIAIHFDSWSSM